jgi:hypothetical protein
LDRERRLVDLVLVEPRLDRGDGAAHAVDPLEVRAGTLLDLVGQRLDEVRAAERVGDVRGARLPGDDLLRPQRDLHRALGRERERLVEGVRVQRLGAAQDRGERLEGRAHDVVLRLLGRQRRAAGLRVEPEHEAPRVRRPEALAHEARPHPPGGSELRDLLEEAHVAGEEEGQPRSELVHREPGVQGRLHVGDPVRERERHLLDRGRPGLAHVVAADRDRVPSREALAAVGEQVRDEPHRGLRRVDVRAPRGVLLQQVVLHRPGQARAVETALLGHELVQEQEDRRGRVDRHRGGHALERDAVEQPVQVLDGVDRHAGLADLALGAGVVGVQAHLGRQVERDRQAGLAVLQEIAEAPVRLLRGRHAGVLPHRPQAAAVHRRMHAAGERRGARPAEVSLGVEALQIGRRVDGLQLDAGVGPPVRLAHLAQRTG